MKINWKFYWAFFLALQPCTSLTYPQNLRLLISRKRLIIYKHYRTKDFQNKVLNNMHLSFGTCMAPVKELQVRPIKMIRERQGISEQKCTTSEYFFWYQAEGACISNKGSRRVQIIWKMSLKLLLFCYSL